MEKEKYKKCDKNGNLQNYNSYSSNNVCEISNNNSNITHITDITNVNSNINTIKLNCFFPKLGREVKLEVDNKMTLKNLKKLIIEKENLGKSIKIYHNEKDMTQCAKLKLSDLFTGDEINLKINLFTRKKTSTSEKRLKYMLECPLHSNENAHFYCYTCKISFCTLCIEEHHPHEYIDKYDYSKSNEEIVNGILEEFIHSVKKLDEGNKNHIFSHIVNQMNVKNKSESNKSLISVADSPIILNEVEKRIGELKAIHEELCHNNQIISKDKTIKKIEDFKANLFKFKMICHSSLSHTQNKKIADIIVLEEEYFLEIHKTLKDLNMGKNALINYMTTLNKEFEEEKKSFEQFDNEIKNDIEKITEKIRNKLKKEDVSNISKCDENENHLLSRFRSNSSVVIDIDKSKFESVDSEFLNIEDSSRQVDKSADKSADKVNKEDKIDIVVPKNRSLFQSDISTSPSEICLTKYILKRRLGTEKKPPDVILYNSSKKTFEIKKIISRPEIKFKRFFQFSVFINVDNNLFISGGKRKNGKCVSDFYSYNPENCELTKLPNMLLERCSHSLIFVHSPQFGVENQIFAIGGYSNNTCERYSGKWERLPDLNYKERQVPTLFLYNSQFLICVFGYINKDLEADDYLERLDLSNPSVWEKIKISHNLSNKFDLKLFNVGLIPINQNQFLICGGEHYKGEESDNVYLLDMKNMSVSNFNNLKMPLKCSFIDKSFVKCTAVKFAQYEMKKNNIVTFNCAKCKFKVKPF